LVFLQAVVARLRTNVYSVVSLHLVPHLSITVASTIIIYIDVFVNILYAIAGHFEHGNEECFIVGRSKPISIPISQVFHPNFSEETDQKGSHMAKLLPDKAKEPILGFSKGVCPRVAQLEVPLIELPKKMVGISHCWFFGLINCVDDFKYLLPEQLVIPAHDDGDILEGAVVDGGVVDVGNGGSALLVADEPEASVRELVPGDEELDEVGGAIFGGVIDEDGVVILVVLVDDGLDVVLVSIVLRVVSGGNNHADRQLLAIGAQMVFLLQSVHLFFDLFFHVALL
jgi:hypothetical protein